MRQNSGAPALASSHSAFASPGSSSAIERIVPGKVTEALFREHEARYVFAGKFVKGKQVLDVACGTGIGTDYLRMAGARTCIGVDIDKGAIDLARVAYNGCTFARCDATRLCLRDGSVDVVVSFETIEHLVDHAKFLQECRRVLRPGGILICSTPNRAISRWYAENPYHVREFTVPEFTAMVRKVLGIFEVYVQDNKNYPLFVFRKLVAYMLDGLHLKGIVKNIVKWKPSPLCLRTEFDRTASNQDDGIQPYSRFSLAQPTFLIAVCHKPVS